VIETGEDSNGWYAIFKGDNNPIRDPSKVRFSQIRRIVVAVIY
jgi:Fe-S-cluster formation regulator IscX/YfhJ